MTRYLAVMLVVVILAACGGEPAPSPDDLVATQVAVKQAAAATLTAEIPMTSGPAVATEPPGSTEVSPPVEEPSPTDKPMPTETPRPTDIPQPTARPEATEIPQAAVPHLLPGETLSHADWEYLVRDTAVTEAIGDMAARGVYVVALLEVTNKASTERELGSRFFTSRDAQGRLYEMDTDASLEYHQSFKTDAWHLEGIGPSATGTIPVVFDVSPDASDVLLVATGTSEPATLLAESAGGESLQLPGDSTTVADWAFVVTDTSTSRSIGDSTARGQYVAVISVVRNDSSTPRELGSDFFVITDQQGRTYQMQSEASLEYYHSFDTDAWHLEALGPSLVGTIPLVFDVSPDASGLNMGSNRGDMEPLSILDSVGGEPIELEGDAYSSSDWEFVVKEVNEMTSVGDETASGQFMAVVIEVKNLALYERELGSSVLLMKDSSGRTYEMDTDASLEYHHTFKTDAWHLEAIGPSLVGTIPILFDVAADASGFLLVTQETEIPLP